MDSGFAGAKIRYSCDELLPLQLLLWLLQSALSIITTVRDHWTHTENQWQTSCEGVTTYGGLNIRRSTEPCRRRFIGSSWQHTPWNTTITRPSNSLFTVRSNNLTSNCYLSSCMALNCLYCAEVPLKNCSLTQWCQGFEMTVREIYPIPSSSLLSFPFLPPFPYLPPLCPYLTSPPLSLEAGPLKSS